MKFKIALISALIFALTTQVADAQVRQRAKTQRVRVKQGIRNGELTRAETRNIARKERVVRRDVRRAKADGVVTGNERKEIRKDQRRASRTIARKKHNHRTRI